MYKVCAKWTRFGNVQLCIIYSQALLYNRTPGDWMGFTKEI